MREPGIAMERARDILRFWDWIPAFRAVAEAQHLPTAATAMGLTPSALSRSVRALEDAIGVRLFDRVGRQLELNTAGQAFLVAARDAMRLVHEGLLAAKQVHVRGRVTISASSLWGPEFLQPSMLQLRDDHPELEPVLVAPMHEPEAALRRGAIDVALVEQRTKDAGLESVFLGRVPQTLCCHPMHPMLKSGCQVPSEPELLKWIARSHFVSVDDIQVSSSGFWPESWRKRIALRVAQGESAMDFMAQGDMLSVLPRPYVQARHLVALPSVPLPERWLLAARRSRLSLFSRADVVVEALLEASQSMRE